MRLRHLAISTPNLLRLLAVVAIGGLAFAGACHPTTWDDGPICEEGACVGPDGPLPPETVTVSDVPPPPITGGTLLVTESGTSAIVADPDRDRIVVVDLVTNAVRAVVPTSARAEPGRSVEDDAGRAYVVLRNAGGIVAIDVASGQPLSVASVCPSPRGVTFAKATHKLYVACAGGELMTLTPGVTPSIERVVSLGDDLRDVQVLGDSLVVSHFRSATVDRVDPATGAVTSTVRPLAPIGPIGESTVAWRTVVTPEGRVFMVHQASQTEVVNVPTTPFVDSAPTTEPSAPDSSAYGGVASTGACDSVVRSIVTELDVVGGSLGQRASSDIAGVPLPVDIAVSGTNAKLAIVGAGSGIILEGEPELLTDGAASCGQFVPTPLDPKGPAQSFGTSRQLPASHEPVAIAYGSHGELIVQTREIAQLEIHDVDTGAIKVTIPLGGADRTDTGHKLFHSNPDGPTGAVVCASCHPEGRDDGHTWFFSDTGLRRTQSLAGFSLDTAPFHWAGDLADVGAVMDAVFVQRMGNRPQTDERKGAITDWLSHMPDAPRAYQREPFAVARGRALFEDPSIGCSSCHSGPRLTNNITVDVGTGRALQVPSLVGVRARAPYMHDGCAETLRDRFTTPCGGGDAHGHTSGLKESQVDDLVAYLESL